MIETTVAAYPPAPEPYADYRARLDALVAARGLNRFAYFHTTGEGTIFPNGDESSSGNVLADDGRIFFFWTDWDVERNELTLKTWEESPEDAPSRPSSEYQRARAFLGLAQAQPTTDTNGEHAVRGVASETSRYVRQTDGRPSGHVLLRLPRSLHQALNERAKAEGVSANQLGVMLLADGLARLDCAGGPASPPKDTTRE
jgi:hypothetical protein